MPKTLVSRVNLPISLLQTCGEASGLHGGDDVATHSLGEPCLETRTSMQLPVPSTDAVGFRHEPCPRRCRYKLAIISHVFTNLSGGELHFKAIGIKYNLSGTYVNVEVAHTVALIILLVIPASY